MSKELFVVGLEHQGPVAAGCWSEMGYSVTAIDVNSDVISGLKKSKLPVEEPGLGELLKKNQAQGRLRFTNSFSPLYPIENLILTHDLRSDGTKPAELSPLWNAVDSLSPYLAENPLVIVRAQVPPTTTHAIGRRIDQLRPDLKGRVGLVYMPENLQLGKALEGFNQPNPPVLGVDTIETKSRVRDVLSLMDVNWQEVDIITAELFKPAMNGYLFVATVLGNTIGDAAEKLGGNGYDLARLMKLDDRVGNRAPLRPGEPNTANTILRDVEWLKRLGGQIIEGAWQSNESRQTLIVDWLKNQFGGDLSGRTVGVWGLTYKPGTSDIRGSWGITTSELLAEEGVRVQSADPMADRKMVNSRSDMSFSEDPYSAAADVDALLLMTGWPDYQMGNIDFRYLRQKMRGNVVVDVPGMWYDAKLSELGFRYRTIGRP